MRMEQYLTFTNHALWEVIVNGDLVSPVASASAGAEGPIPPKTAEQKLARKNELKAKITLMLAIPDEHLLKFHASFVSSKNSYSTNEIVNTAHSVSAASSKDQSSTTSYADDVMLSLFSNQSNAPQLDNEDLEQINTDDLEEMDLKWKVAMLTMRVKRFIKKTRRKLDLNGTETVGFDRTKVKCYNCYRRGHFAREYRAPRNQGNRNRDAPTRNALVDTSTTNALVVQDGIGYQIELESLEARIVDHENNEAVYEEDIAFLKYDVQVKDISIKEIKNQLENALKEKDDLKLKLEKFKTSFKNLTKLINSQISAIDKTGLGYDGQINESDLNDIHVNKSEVLNNVVDSHESDGDDNQVNNMFKKGEGYHAVPSPYTGTYMPPRADLSFAVLDNSVFKSKVSEPITSVPKIETNASKTSKDSLEKPKTVRSSAPLIEEWESDSEDENVFKPKEVKKTVNLAWKRLNLLMLGIQLLKMKTELKNLGSSFRVPGIIKKLMVDLLHLEEMLNEELKFNLLSVLQMCDMKNSVLFTDTECVVLSPDLKLLDESQVLLKVPRNMHNFDLKNVVPVGGLTFLFAKATLDESNIWHERLGHINFRTMNKLVRGNLVRGFPLKLFENDHTCVACQKEKQHKASCKTKTVSYICKPLQLLHMDLFGPVSIKRINKKTYFLVVTDDYSRFSWVFFLATKDETPEILKNFIADIENQMDHKVKTIRCDNETEFKNRIMNEFCEMEGIRREFSVARTLSKMVLLREKNRTLIQAARTMLADSKLPTTFWAEAVNTTCYVQNRVLVIKPHNKTSYELFLGRKPSLSFMRPFGCLVTILNTLDHLGTGPNRMFDINTLTMSMNYQPVFVGNQTNGNAGTKANINVGQAGKKTVPGPQYVLLPLLTSDSQGPKSLENEVDDDARKKSTEVPRKENRVQDPAKKAANTNNTNKLNTVSSPVNVVSSFTTVDLGKERAQRNEFESMSGQDKDANGNKMFTPVSATGSTYVNLGGSIPDNAATLPTNPLMPDLEDTANLYLIPTTRIHKDHPKEQIIGDPLSAPQTRRMAKTSQEHVMFRLQKVWRLVDLPKGKHAIGIKWVYRNKKDKRGIVIRNKARLVAQGYTQEEGINYDDVFAPVATIEAIRLFLAYASFMGFILYQMDVKSVFLYGTIEEEVYVCQPPSFEDPHFPDNVYKVMQRDDGIFICQDKYEAYILKKFDFSSVKTSSTLIETNKALLKDEEAEDVDVYLYKSMIGSLMYLIDFRPDIMFAVCACARFQVTPKVIHLHAVKRIFRYLKGQPKLGLWYPKDSPFDLEAFSDSDYAGASHDRKSTTGEYVAAANCCGQFWATANVKNVNGEAHIQALVDKKKVIITEASIRRDLRFKDEGGVDCLSNEVIFEQLTLMAPEDMGEGLEIPTDPYHTPIVSQPSSSPPQKKQKSKRKQRKEIKVPSPSSKIPNKERLPTTSNDPLPTKTAQAKEIASLKKRVKKLEQKRQSRTSRLKRLRKVRSARRVESSTKASLGDHEDASKQGRMIDNIDQDIEITLVDDTQGRMNEEDMFRVNDLDGDEVVVDVSSGEKVDQSVKVVEK
uniref:Integrase catalytic domain-containing protein n=1 Tax=Tanacetum cinerariifolium TaxID=118510 RepID=A0A6L2JUB0_TANCI|nr:hypothetical protein [Tanacetum cinerariifolium]